MRVAEDTGLARCRVSELAWRGVVGVTSRRRVIHDNGVGIFFGGRDGITNETGEARCVLVDGGAEIGRGNIGTGE